MLDLDYERLAAEFLRALRGHRSQVQLSRRLRYRSNVSYLWESGRNWPTAARTLWAATRVGVDVRAAVAGFYRSEPSFLELDLTSRAGVAAMVDDLRGDIPIVELAERTGRSRYAVARWLRGQTEPRLPDFFRLIEASSHRLLDFIAQLVDITALPSTAEPWRQITAARELVARFPWTPAIILALQTADYQALPLHRDGWLAERLGLPLEIETECLELLAASGQIHRIGGLWRVARIQTVDTRSDPDAGKRLKRWWAQVGIDAIEAERPGLFSFNIFSVSSADLARLEEMHRNYYRALRSVVAASEPPERVVVANLQLFALDSKQT